jgi:hypothetical protein
MSVFDALIIRGTLVANPTLRANLRELVARISESAISDCEAAQIEDNLVQALRLGEAKRMPSSLPPRGVAMQLTSEQVTIVRTTLGRFNDVALGHKMLERFEAALRDGSALAGSR